MVAATAPSTVHSQKDLLGRSCPRRTAIAAVAAGRRPMTTAAWLAGLVRKAIEVSRGNPRTTPPATTASRPHWRPRGNF